MAKSCHPYLGRYVGKFIRLRYIGRTKEKVMSEKNIGSSFDDFITESPILDEATAVAVKRVVSWRIEQEIKAQALTRQLRRRRCTPALATLN
jgi:hypothetical protein